MMVDLVTVVSPPTRVLSGAVGSRSIVDFLLALHNINVDRTFALVDDGGLGDTFGFLVILQSRQQQLRTHVGVFNCSALP